jgi:predicted glycoside hydrolase/deacetylase ChbG (UPF0249 family)
MSRYLIVNADDYNTDPERNRGILDAVRNGIVTSVTVLANLPFEPESLSALKTALGSAIGVHLNLTRGRPLTGESKTLANGDGLFFTRGQAWRRALLGKYDFAEVEAEFSAQTERLLEAGITPDHIDGNNHIHVFPGLAGTAARVAQRFGIERIRLPLEPFENFRQVLKQGTFKKALISKLSRIAATIFESSALRFTDRFAGIMRPCVSDAGSLRAFLRDLPEGTTELMCHPGYAATGDNPFSNEERARETKSLMSPEVIETIRRSGVKLIAYKDL